MPAYTRPTSLAGRTLARILAVRDILRQRRRLAELDAAALRDLGLTRDDVARELASPFWMRSGFRAGGDERLAGRRPLTRHG